MKPFVTVLGVVLLVTLAGCGAAGSNVDSQTTPLSGNAGASASGGGEDDEDSSLDGMGDSSDNDPDLTIPPADSFPVGTSIDGIGDPTVIVVDHLGHLENASYTSTRTDTYTAEGYSYATTYVRSVDGPRQLMTVDYSGQYQEVYRGSSESPNYIRWETDQGVRYLIDHGDVLYLGESTYFIQSLLEAATFEFVRTEGNGEVFVFAVTGFEATDDLRSATTLETVDELHGTVSIRDDGLILRLSISLAGADLDGVLTELEIDQFVSGFGSTDVSDPSWLVEAEERAIVMEASLDGDGRYIEITMIRGDEIPAGAQGFFYVGDLALETAFDETLALGQSFYIYETSAGELTVGLEAPSVAEVGALVPDSVGEVSVAIFHEDVGTIYVSTLELGASSS